jgi:hypothetical protein
MRIRSFGVYGYRGRFDWEWNESYAFPTWAEVEAAIRRLDANEFAGVDFVLDDVSPAEEEPPSLHITGGQGQYIISYSDGSRVPRYYMDPGKAGEELIGVIRRDQGVWVRPNLVCLDLELVVAIARYTAETGRAYPDVTWR